MKKPTTQYEEVMKALEKVDDFLAMRDEDAAPEFEETNDPERPFRTEYAFESVTEKHTRYKRVDINV